MTNYKIENHDLLNSIVEMEKRSCDNSAFHQWAYETTMDRDQKIKAVDELWQIAELPCGLSELLMIMDRYKSDIKTNAIKHKVVQRAWKPEPDIEINTNSYIAWVRRQNKMAEKTILTELTYHDSLGSIHGFGFRLHVWDEKVSRTEYGYNEKYTDGDIVDQVFYELLCKLYCKELKHFNETDSKMVKLTAVRRYINEQDYPCFSDRIWNACMNHKVDEVTEQELDIALRAYKELDDHIKTLEEETQAKLAVYELLTGVAK